MLKIDSNEKIVIVLAHLDDEFAFAPLIKDFYPYKKKIYNSYTVQKD